MWKAYHIPETLEEAVYLLSRYDGQARIIAGGTDLVLDLESRSQPVAALIDITRIPELERIEVIGNNITLGATVTFTQVLQSALLSATAPHLQAAARTISGRQIRNVATVIGNIVNASPAADSAPPLSTLNASVHILGTNGKTRILPIADFVRGVRCVALMPGELVVAVSFPRPSSEWRMSFRKLGLRRSMAIAVTSAAVMIQVRNDTISEARIALGAVAPTVIRAEEAEDTLSSQNVSRALSCGAPQLAREAALPIDDFRASASYRLEMVEALVRAQLRDLLET